MFEAVIFDCDGVLVDSEALGLEDSARYLQSHGLNWSPADLVRIFTGFRDDVFAAKLTQAYRDVHKADPSPDFFTGLVEQRRKKKDQLQAVSGAHDALRAIKLPMAVASSSRSEFLESKLKRVDLWTLAAPHIYSADLVEHGKPAPDIFLYAAEKLETSPENCLVVEDSVNGVMAGVAAGMTVWGFTGGGHCFEGHGDRLIEAGAVEVMDGFSSLINKL